MGYFPSSDFLSKRKNEKIFIGKRKKYFQEKASNSYLSFLVSKSFHFIFFLFVVYFDQQPVALLTVHLSKSFFGHFHIVSHVFLSKERKNTQSLLQINLFTYFYFLMVKDRKDLQHQK